MAKSHEKRAWIQTEDETYLVGVPAESGRSPIRELVERIYHVESARPVSRARAILRERIHADVEASIADRETVKVAAKRLSAPSDRPPPNSSAANVVVLPEAPPTPPFLVPELVVGATLDPAAISEALERLKRATTPARERWSSDRPIAAILVDGANRILAYAWNTNAAIRTRHAEWNLCESLAGRAIPEDAVLYVSLKPCRMCAARIWEAAADPARLDVRYFENDPGPLAQGTMLEARSPARTRYLGLSDPRFSAEISRQVDGRARPIRPA